MYIRETINGKAGSEIFRYNNPRSEEADYTQPLALPHLEFFYEVLLYILKVWTLD